MARRASCPRPSHPIEIASPQAPSASRCRENPPKLTFTGSLFRLNPAPDEARIGDLAHLVSHELDGHFAPGRCAIGGGHGANTIGRAIHPGHQRAVKPARVMRSSPSAALASFMAARKMPCAMRLG